MLKILLIIVAIVLMVVPSIPLSSSKELRRPRTVYLGAAIFVLVLLNIFVSLPPEIELWAFAIIPIVTIVGALILATPKIEASCKTEQVKPTGGRIVNAITWGLMIFILGFLIFVAIGMLLR